MFMTQFSRYRQNKLVSKFVDVVSQQFGQSFHGTYEFARNILHTDIVYLNASSDVKNPTFWRKNRGMRLWITKWTFEELLVQAQQT